jgi:hypothetical protein
MKTSVLVGVHTTVVALLLAIALPDRVRAEDASKPSAPPGGATPPASAPSLAVPMSPGVQDVQRLLQAKVGEETILAYINNSSTSYNLSAADIVQLRGQGASDRVITAMLNHRYTPPPAPVAPPATAPAPDQSAANTEAAPPAAAQSSTVYVTSPPPPYPYYYYPYYPYYYPYYYYPYSTIVFGFGSFHGHDHDHHGHWAGPHGGVAHGGHH